MHANWKTWAHVTKLDPDKHLPQGAIEEIATSGTDALMLSGTLNVTPENLSELLDLVSAYGLPLVVEPAGPECAIFDGAIDYLFVPSVMNTDDVRWIVGKHHTWLRHASSIMWDMVVPEAYIVLNPNSAVGRVTGANCALSAEDVAAFAEVADRYFHFPIVYIEYSGTYGDPSIVQAAANAVEHATLYYGGGIRSAEQAAEMGRIADTIVVGNAVYEEGIDVLRATVRAVQ
ncbi:MULTISPECIES: phosphoglycerol geranylgeranyltransferase [Methanoculleus]|jgi:phosphoglycerol geranylgeranyltransferase|uniref:Geranylgeranylglyceryl phosphate synthase n=1 Tax=Methanoculleus thermophilus TaxID=2200 RepID=A0A1G8Y328_9EURY|nr:MULTISPECIES: phosphoglycerol geranylgeranyltransferase [Methanoculleus]SDJ97206.1 phosphoglycerol geranylgeranyltransferase [Methanoculleus thermophilus]HQD26698.1 phosphoglycerol geranylgeranyltransferase [Methanoculleus thermophilus]